MKKLAKIFIGLIVSVAILLLIGAGIYYVYAPVKIDKPTLVVIPANSSSSFIADELAKNDVIRSSLVFKLYLKYTGDGGSLQAGSYAFSDSINIDEVIYMIKNGQVAGNMVTIPEGYNLQQIIQTLVDAGVCTKESFYKAMNEEYPYDYLPSIGTKNRLEGYLFPETYRFSKRMGAPAAIGLMLKQFDTVFTEEWRDRLKETGMSMQELVTLASIIEKEAKVPEDRPIISGVFKKRLAINMPLQSCATIQYILGEVKPRLTYDDLRIKSPYNTYQHKGLPPGPIASPGRASLEAALYPKETNYLYFVARPDGSHVFSETLAEHNKAKAEVNK